MEILLGLNYYVSLKQTLSHHDLGLPYLPVVDVVDDVVVVVDNVVDVDVDVNGQYDHQWVEHLVINHFVLKIPNRLQFLHL